MKSELSAQECIFFHTPTKDARHLLFYPLGVGKFQRGNSYRVHRLRYDSFLILYVFEGSLQLKQKNACYRAEKGDVLLVDCYEEHEYFTDGHVDMIWLHFDGSTSRTWFEALTNDRGQRIRGSRQCPQILGEILSGIQNAENEYSLSNRIYTLLCDLAFFAETYAAEHSGSAVSDAKAFMENRLADPITVEQIARAVHFSPSHFSKIFKTVTKVSPYEYLLTRRIERAKQLLLYTNLPLEIVAQQTGFNSLPHFICAFKKATGMTPLKFRKLHF